MFTSYHIIKVPDKFDSFKGILLLYQLNENPFKLGCVDIWIFFMYLLKVRSCDMRCI